MSDIYFGEILYICVKLKSKNELRIKNTNYQHIINNNNPFFFINIPHIYIYILN